MNGENIILALILLTNIYFLSASRLRGVIKYVGVQGILIGLVSFLLSLGHYDFYFIFFSLLVILSKGILFPWMLIKRLDDTRVSSEINPHISFAPSIIIGLFLLFFCLWLAKNFPVNIIESSIQSLVIATFTILVGLFILMARSKVITQVIGYLIFENGLFLLGVSLARGIPLIVEMGILLDTLVAIVIMGMAIRRIHIEYESLSIDKLTNLRG